VARVERACVDFLFAGCELLERAVVDPDGADDLLLVPDRDACLPDVADDLLLVPDLDDGLRDVADCGRRDVGLC